jgi:PPOX class probable F420-dependent enzyme
MVDESWVAGALQQARVARLATLGVDGAVRLVPICFAVVDGWVVSAVDHKPKRTGQLRRLDDVRASGRATLLVDHYDDDWSRLTYALIVGRAEIVARPGPAYADALIHLRARYPQYRSIDLTPERNPVVRITPEQIHRWSATPAGDG